MSENPLLLKEGRLRRRCRRGWFLKATDHLNHPACSQGSQAPLLQKEGILPFSDSFTAHRSAYSASRSSLRWNCGSHTPGDFVREGLAHGIEFFGLGVEIICPPDEGIHGFCCGTRSSELAQQREVFIVFEAFTYKFESDALDRNICSAANDIGT